MRLLSGMVLFAVLVLLWYFPAVLKGGDDYLHATLFMHTIDRYSKGIDSSQAALLLFLHLSWPILTLDLFPAGCDPLRLFERNH